MGLRKEKKSIFKLVIKYRMETLVKIFLGFLILGILTVSSLFMKKYIETDLTNEVKTIKVQQRRRNLDNVSSEGYISQGYSSPYQIETDSENIEERKRVRNYEITFFVDDHDVGLTHSFNYILVGDKGNTPPIGQPRFNTTSVRNKVAYFDLGNLEKILIYPPQGDVKFFSRINLTQIEIRDGLDVYQLAGSRSTSLRDRILSVNEEFENYVRKWNYEKEELDKKVKRINDGLDPGRPERFIGIFREKYKYSPTKWASQKMGEEKTKYIHLPQYEFSHRPMYSDHYWMQEKIPKYILINHVNFDSLTEPLPDYPGYFAFDLKKKSKSTNNLI